MTQPRLIRPGATYAICRRVERRRFLLRPDDGLTELFKWVLAVTANQFAVEVHVAVCMSTHFHLVVTVPNANVSEFMHALDVRLARSIQVLREYADGVVWAPGKLSITELRTREAVVEQIAYAIANPVKAGLVYKASQWPGATVAVAEIGVASWTAERPNVYFSKRKRWPEIATLALAMPACLEELGVEVAHELLAAELERQEREARAFVKENRWRVMGATAAMNVSPYRSAKSWLELGKLAPHIAAGRGQGDARVAAIEELIEFRLAYRVARLRWIAGDRNVEFPPGTYWMRVNFGVRVAPFS